MFQRDKAKDYIQKYWKSITRENREDTGTLIGLPFPYLVPSNEEMFQELYYLDSYFISLGLLDSPLEDFIIHITEDLASLIGRFGFIPNASRYYFTSRSQPPVFSRMVWLSYRVKEKRKDPDKIDFLSRMIQTAEVEYHTAWMSEKLPHPRKVYKGLSRYFDINYLDILAGCESGWDHSTRCEDKWLDYLPVDLNSILYIIEMDIARAKDLLGKPDEAETWREKAEARQRTMTELMWDPEMELFSDYNWKTRQRLFHPSLAAFYPLWAGLANREQAESMVTKWLPKFLHPGGLVTSLEPKAERQWAYPNGWAPLQWITDAGLERYGFSEEAGEIRRRWCHTCEYQFEKTGAFWEKYNVVDPDADVEPGLYGQIKGFGWSNSVYLDFIKRLDG